MKRKYNPIFLLFIVSVVFASCQTPSELQSSPQPSTSSKYLQEVKTFLKKKVTVGKTTKEEVLKFSGKPHLKIDIDISEAELFSRHMLGGKDLALERWSYMTSSSAKSILGENRLLFLVRVGLFKEGVFSADFYFDKDGIVRAYEVGEYVT